MLTMVPALRSAHGWQQQLRQAGRTEQIDFELIASFLQRDVLDGAVEAEAGVIDQDIDAPNLVQNGLHGGFDLIVPGHIHPQRDGAEGGQVAHLFNAARGDIDPVAVLDQLARDGFAHTGGGSGHQGCLLFACPGHVRLSCC